MYLRRDLLSRLENDERGTVAIVFALLVVALFGLTALAVDAARAYSVSSKVTSALDAAALAGAKLLDKGASDAEILTTAQTFFNDHIASMRVHNVTLTNFNIAVDRAASTVTTNVDSRMATTFAGVVGISKIDMNRTATVVYKFRYIELSMALDITGSMDNNGKIAALRNAAREVVDTLLEGSGAEDSVRIALVPWSSSVNAGSLAGAASNNVSVDNCVVERPGVNATTDAGPGPASFYNAVTTIDGHYGCPNDAIMPLKGRSQRNALKDTINAYNAFGWTAGHIGAAWAWNLVSPSWSSELPSSSRPRVYNKDETIKSVVIMTDGLFNTAYVTGTNTPEATMIEESYGQFQLLCSGMKARHIVVYTIGFDLNDPRAADELRTCATSTSTYFQAVNGNDLRDAFRTIADQLSSMRISR